MSATSPMTTLYLKGAGARPLSRGHLWVFSGAVAKVDGQAQAGEVVRLVNPSGEFLAWAWYAPESRIRARVLSFDPAAEFGPGWWRERLAKAVARRARLRGDGRTSALRLVHAEADWLPGLTIDLYGDAAVLQALTAGAEALKGEVAAWLAENLGAATVYQRGDQELRRLEGLGPVKGPLLGPEPAAPARIVEDGLTFEVDLVGGQKTGWFLDQRFNRRAVAGHAAGRTVLDCFTYAGGFAAQALAAGAEAATLIDSSAKALRQARTNLEINGLAERATLAQGNVFEVLRHYRDEGRRFGLIILDPPKLAPTRAQAQQAARAYKDLNLMALKLLAEGGLLATFSCSAGVEAEFFQEIVHWAAQDAKVHLQILARLGQPEDHPVLLGQPESEYLKGLLCRPV